MITLFENKGWEKLAISQSSKFQAAMPQLSVLKEVWKHVYHAPKDKKIFPTSLNYALGKSRESRANTTGPCALVAK